MYFLFNPTYALFQKKTGQVLGSRLVHVKQNFLFQLYTQKTNNNKNGTVQFGISVLQIGLTTT